jgi:hypothetical protein
MVVFYLSAFVVVLNLNAYKQSIFIFGYFTISILSSICIDLKIDIFSSKTVYNIYDLFLGPTVMFSGYIFNSWKNGTVYILILIFCSFLLEMFFSFSLIHPAINSILLIVLIFDFFKFKFRLKDIDSLTEYSFVLILVFLNHFFQLFGYFKEDISENSFDYLMVYYINSIIHGVFYIYVIFKYLKSKYVF